MRREARPMQAKRWKILYLLVGLACGCAVATPKKPSTPVAPVLTPTSVKPVVVRPFPRELIFSLVKKWTQGFSGRSGVVCGLLTELDPVVHRADDSFEAASLVKLPILVELARRQERGLCKLADGLTFEERHRVGGSGVLKDRPAGQSYRLDQLAEWMIAESDNVATDMLLEYLGLSSIEGEMVRLGLKQTTVQRKVFAFEEIDQGRDNLISAADAATLLRGIATHQLPGSAWMLEVLHKTRRRDLLAAQLPADLKVAHKTGELTGFLHDAAIVYADPPYLLVILSAADKPASEKFIQGLSGDIYRALSASRH
jgi:beta-lactamase class A